jgi:hypothetical protein
MGASGGKLMAALALFDVLKDFGARPLPAAGASPAQQPRPEHNSASAAQPDIAQIVRTEVEKAEIQLEQRLALAHAAALEAQRQEHAAEVEAMLRRFGESAGETIAARIDEMESRIGDQAAATAARILGAFLSEELQKRSMQSLAQSIRAAATDREAVRIEVRGPQSLFETLSAALGDHAAEFSYVEAPGFDLVVTIDGNLFETRLSEWSAALADILA